MRRILSEKNMGVQGYFLKKQALHTELNERVEAATRSYSAEVDFLQYIYLVLVAKNQMALSQKNHHITIIIHFTVIKRRFSPCYMHQFLNFQLTSCLYTICNNKTFFLHFDWKRDSGHI